MDQPTKAPITIESLENLESASFTVRLQNGDELLIDGKPVTITMHGLGSKEQVTAEFKRSRAVNASTMAALQGRTSRDAAREGFEREATYLAECTKSIDNWPFGSAADLYMNHKLGYIAEQADRFIKDAANFMKASTKT